MIYRIKYIDEIRGFYDSDLIKIKGPHLHQAGECWLI